VGAAAVLLGAGAMVATRPYLTHIDDPENEVEQLTDEATAITIGSDS
jgi:ACDE family multidrug resistance protein